MPPVTSPVTSPAPSPIPQTPRLIIYHQTHYHRNEYISMLPLSRGGRRTTHVILAAIHLNATPGEITLNDDPPFCAKHERLWEEARLLQADGVKVMGMLGGAAKGTFKRLDCSDEMEFYDFYDPLCQVISKAGLDGLDLDVEEEMSLPGVIRLIDQLRRDFGDGFIITLAPVANAMMGPERKQLSGFDYEALEVARGNDIAWYNAQFYNGWGYVEDTQYWDAIMKRGWKPEKIVVGVLTNPESGKGWVPDEMLGRTLKQIKAKHPDFGGVMGWEYFNSLTVAAPYGWPWSWADLLTEILHPPTATAASTETRNGQTPV